MRTETDKLTKGEGKTDLNTPGRVNKQMAGETNRAKMVRKTQRQEVYKSQP